MASNDNGGPWGNRGGSGANGGGQDGGNGGGGRDPWDGKTGNRGGGRGPGGQPPVPDIDEIVRKGQEQLKILMGGRSGRGRGPTGGGGGGGGGCGLPSSVESSVPPPPQAASVAMRASANARRLAVRIVERVNMTGPWGLMLPMIGECARHCPLGHQQPLAMPGAQAGASSATSNRQFAS